MRIAVAFDVLRRWLRAATGYDVTFVRNVTDIDDKILAKSAETGEPWYAVSYRNERASAAALDALGVLPPTYEPRATGHVPEMVDADGRAHRARPRLRRRATAAATSTSTCAAGPSTAR